MEDAPIKLRCAYCGGIGELKSGDVVWPGRGQPRLYVCENFPACDSYVRCHAGTTTPLGSLAGPRLRRLRKLAHDMFDPLWQHNSNPLGRTAAYAAAATVMGTQGEFHIGDLDEKGCEAFMTNIADVEAEMDRRIGHHNDRLAPPEAITLQILSALFNPDIDTFLAQIPVATMQSYRDAWLDAKRCGLVVEAGDNLQLSPKGRRALFAAPQ